MSIAARAQSRRFASAPRLFSIGVTSCKDFKMTRSTGSAQLVELGSTMIDDLALARAIHVLALVHWIGGVTVVATIVLPRARALPDAKQAIASFEAFERRFASQVRVSILLVGLSGAYMLMKDGAWDRLQQASFWWLHLMIAVWVLFALIVYVLEPLALHRLFREFALRNKDRAFALATGLHALALTVAAFAIGAGVVGAHGGLP
jgi:uncharacterized membrane protein